MNDFYKPFLVPNRYLCAVKNNNKRCGLASFHFRTRSATTVRIDETSVHTIFMYRNGGVLHSLFQLSKVAVWSEKSQ